MPAFIDTWLHTDSKHITIYPPLSGHNNIQRNGSKHAQHQHQPLDLMEHRRMKTLQLFSLLSIKDHGPTLIKQILWINKNSLRGWWSKTDLNNGIFTINQKANRMFISFSSRLLVPVPIHWCWFTFTIQLIERILRQTSQEESRFPEISQILER